MKDPFLSPKVIIAIAVVNLSLPAVFIRLADTNPLSIAFLRLFLAALVLWPLAARKVIKTWESLNRTEKWRILSSGFFLGIHMSLWVTSVTKTTIASAAFLIITQPLIVAVLGHFLLKERINRWTVWAIVLCLIGTALINSGDLQLGPDYLWGDFLALAGAVFAAFYLLAGRSLRPKVDNLPYVTLVYSTAALVLMPVCFITSAPLFTLSRNAYFWIIMLTLLPTLIGHSFYNYALRYLKAFTVNISIVVEPIGAAVLAWIIFMEQPSVMLYPGAGLLIVSLILAFRGD